MIKLTKLISWRLTTIGGNRGDEFDTSLEPDAVPKSLANIHSYWPVYVSVGIGILMNGKD